MDTYGYMYIYIYNFAIWMIYVLDFSVGSGWQLDLDDIYIEVF